MIRRFLRVDALVRLAGAAACTGGLVTLTACGLVLDVGDNEQSAALDDDDDDDNDENDDGTAALCLDAPGFIATVPADPGQSLQDWTAVGGAVVDNDGVTAAVFLSDAIADGSAALFTDVAMPACFVPMALQLNTSIVGRDMPQNTSTALIGGVPLDVSDMSWGQSSTSCVGARAYGGTRRLEVRVRGEAYGFEAMGEIEAVALVAEPSCPTPGEVVPFSSWTLEPGETFFGASVAVVANQLDMTTAGSCDRVVAEGPLGGAVAFPDVAGAGLRIVVDGDDTLGPGADGDSDGLYVTIGPVRQQLESGDNLVCPPRAMRGTTDRLRFELTAGSGASAEPAAMHALVHLPEIVEGVCDDALVPDGDLDGSAGVVTGDGFDIDNTGIEGGVFFAEAGSVCGASQLMMMASVPEATTTAGPALVTRHTLTGSQTAYWALQDWSLTQELATATAPATTTACLPATRSGEVISILVGVNGPGGTCADQLPPGRFELEAIDVVLDEACAP